MLAVYDNDENKMDVGVEARPQDRDDDQHKRRCRRRSCRYRPHCAARVYSCYTLRPSHDNTAYIDILTAVDDDGGPLSSLCKPSKSRPRRSPVGNAHAARQNES